VGVDDGTPRARDEFSGEESWKGNMGKDEEEEGRAESAERVVAERCLG